MDLFGFVFVVMLFCLFEMMCCVFVVVFCRKDGVCIVGFGVLILLGGFGFGLFVNFGVLLWVGVLIFFVFFVLMFVFIVMMLIYFLWCYVCIYV